jgi:glutathione S-transferase
METLERGLVADFIAGEYSVADMALYGYVHCADEAGADLAEYPRINAWIERVEAQPGFVNDLEPITWTDS